MPQTIRLLPLAWFFLAASVLAEPTADATQTEEPTAAPQETILVQFSTTLGDIKVELYPEQAPQTVDNFLHYVNSGFYEDVIFHRVVPGFVVQTGGFDTKYQRKATVDPIENESNNGLKNLRGTLSMARTNAPNSATSQFFISLRDNPSLDWSGRPGYAVFGAVIEGMDVVDKMAEKPQGEHKGVFNNAPNEAIVIKKAKVLEND